MTNIDFINAYKNEEQIITDYYKYNNGNQILELNGIVNPLKIDNRHLMSPTDNQLNTPHCAAYSAATLIESLYWKTTGKLIQIDSHQVYAKAKEIDKDYYSDGTYLEAAMTAVLNLCKKSKEFDFLKNYKINTFFNNKNEETINYVKFLLHKYDFLQVGFNIDEGWYSCNNNNYILKACGNNLGGHAVNLCGYDVDGFYILNQWSTTFGSKGFAIIPYKLFITQFMYGIYLTENGESNG